MGDNNDKEFLDEFDIDVKRLIKHLVQFIVIIILFNILSTFFRGKTILLFEEIISLEIILLILFGLLSLPLVGRLVADTRILIALLSSFIIKRFPGMTQEVHPLIRIFRDIVYIIILFLVSVPAIPLFSQYMVFGYHVTHIVSLLLLALLVVFLYDLSKNIFQLTHGHLKEAAAHFLKIMDKLNKKK
ncbi:hypothetical protein JW930_04310 [Candidatus Woesearchaeota archaeon]|nr:hypothetical protein [Candidatus Woesearchaeota archaeon]